MISHEFKCIFIHIPKCAGTSIERALGHLDKHSGRGAQDHRNIRMIEQPVLTPRIFASKENFLDALRRARHVFRSEANPYNKLTVSREQYESYYKFTVVRNPWARAYSWYKNVMRDEIFKRNLGIADQISFDAFLACHCGKGLLRPQTYWIKDFRGTIPLDYVGRFENLAGDFRAICEAIGRLGITLPHELKTENQGYHEHYNSRSIDLIGKVYEEEIEMFGYTFEA